MSQNNLPNNLPGIEKIIQRIQIAEKTQQKEIRISISEAKDLVNELAILTSKLGKTVQDIHHMLSVIQKNSSEVDIKFDGGAF